MKAAVRCAALTLAQLRAQEAHGKRLDKSSARRVIRNTPPLVAGGLNLADRLAAHTEGTKQNAAAKKVALHFIVRFPPEVLGDDAPTPFARLDREARERLMLRQAVKFIQETHGGRAVFAARLDRDEAGESVVDVFACPKYDKATKKGATAWTSLTKFGKALALKHQDEVRRRSPQHEGAEAITSPRAIGMSLQSEFAAFFARENGHRLDPKRQKDAPAPDRLEVEAWRLGMMRQEQAEAEAAAAKAEQDRIAAQQEADATAQKAAAEKAAFRRQARAWVDRERAALASKHEEADRDRAAAAAELMTARTALDRLKEAYLAVRSSLPRIRQILTWDLATEDELRRARSDRRQVVQVAPALRRAIEDARRVTESPALEKAGKESPTTAFERSDSFGM